MKRSERVGFIQQALDSYVHRERKLVGGHLREELAENRDGAIRAAVVQDGREHAIEDDSHKLDRVAPLRIEALDVARRLGLVRPEVPVGYRLNVS